VTEKGNPRDEERHGQNRMPHQVRLPGFIKDDAIGLGEVIKRATSTVGIRPCSACGRRATTLNSWLMFSGSRPRT
jgi:hypothetical protein